MKTKKYKTLVGLLRALDKKWFSMSDFLSGRGIFNTKTYEWYNIELTDDALRELSDGFCSALGCQKIKYDTVFYNMKYKRIQDCGILSRLWVELRNGKPSFTYCVGQDGDYEYALVKRILYRGY